MDKSGCITRVGSQESGVEGKRKEMNKENESKREDRTIRLNESKRMSEES